MPGIDCAYLAMDTEEGVEVVWNEVQFSERRNFKAQEEKIQLVFENLTQLEHPNIVKFHRYWTDTHNDKPRVSCPHCYLTDNFKYLLNSNLLSLTDPIIFDHHKLSVSYQGCRVGIKATDSDLYCVRLRLLILHYNQNFKHITSYLFCTKKVIIRQN